MHHARKAMHHRARSIHKKAMHHKVRATHKRTCITKYKEVMHQKVQHRQRAADTARQYPHEHNNNIPNVPTKFYNMDHQVQFNSSNKCGKPVHLSGGRDGQDTDRALTARSAFGQRTSTGHLPARGKRRRREITSMWVTTVS